MENRVTVGLAQIYPKLGNIQANFECHQDMIERAVAQGAQLVIFPELSLTGYDLRDLVQEIAITRQDKVIEGLCDISVQKQVDVMFGFAESDTRGDFYIAAAYVSRGEILHIHRKVYLPTYGMFDEGRYFTSGEHVRAFNTPFGRVGMLICEDFWHLALPYLLWMDGADVLLFQSASPGRGINTSDKLYSSFWVELVNQAYGSMLTNYVVHCNRVGFEDGLNFWGGSTIVDPDGNFLLKGQYFQEELLVHTLDLNQIRRTRSRLPLLRDEKRDLVQRELARILGEVGVVR